MGGYGQTSIGGVIDFLNAKRDFGAVGDFVNDDTTAINNALAAGRAVFLPEGHYKLTGLLLPATGVMLFGAGKGKTIIEMVGTGSAGIQPADDCVFGNFTLRGPNSASVHSGID